ncbi:hypothetical protein [Pseudomonas eucalypticola]|uniref:Uncharacterized protein n=1 Tax=Pseudomonas eucalypticola TaxID=2599595 RepID=A0A7D5DBC0_9PSED|nr:hypothetical protein [Pseudomonas eucalypticola]QKZ07292.1 hypothetical protein HWQ56_27325 [Pseudomonas eucalypticola]
MTAQPFNWNFQGRLVALDQGAGLASRPDFAALMALDALSVIIFDPASRLHGSPLGEHPHVQIFNGITLGDGRPTTLHACLDSQLSGTRPPQPLASLPAPLQRGAQVLARLPIRSTRLDGLQGLKSLDWLVLDDRHDTLGIVHHAGATLGQLLLAQVSVSMLAPQAEHFEFGPLCQRLAEHGLQFYRFHAPSHLSQFPAELDLTAPRATQLHSVQALFIPTPERLAQLLPQRRLKLAFVLDTAYGLHDLAYRLLAGVDQGQAAAYLQARHYLPAANLAATTFTLTAEYSPAPW